MTIPIIQVSYVRLPTQKIEESARFATDLLGLQRNNAVGSDVMFRCDNFYHRICFAAGPQDQQTIGIELPDESHVEPARAALKAAGFPVRDATEDECKRRFIRQGLVTQDASGNVVDLVVRPSAAGRRYFPPRDAGITGFQGIAVRSTDVARDLVFWTSVLGAKISDRVGDITYLRIDDRHHRIALYPSNRKGILEVAFDVESLDCIMQSNYFLRERQVKVVHGPGRETASHQIFVRFQGPDDCLFAYVCEMQDVKPGDRARQFNTKPESLCVWGSECTDVPELALSSL